MPNNFIVAVSPEKAHRVGELMGNDTVYQFILHHWLHCHGAVEKAVTAIKPLPPITNYLDITQ